MDLFVKDERKSRWQFDFHGRAGEYFIICLTNVILCIITLGIYTPWAMVRSRRYIYEHMELNGARFGYHATGLAIFLSWFCFFCYIVSISFVESIPELELVLLLAFFLVLPVFMVKSIKYNAIMTTLNNVRFNFHSPLGRAWWVMMGLPVVLYILLAIVVLAIMNIPGEDSYDIGAIITKAVLVFAIILVGVGVIAGIVYAKWISLVGEGGQFGVHRFSVAVSVKQCIKVCLLSMLILVPFLAVIAWLFSDIFGAIMLANMSGGMSDEMLGVLILDYMGQIIACYLLYFAAILLSTGYMWMGLRNHFMNNLTLADGGIRFHSGIAFHALVAQWVLIAVVSSITLGLAYPLMKIRYLRFLAANTWVDGDLDTLELTDHNEQPETGPIAVLSRGMMPQVPFI
ncbi:TPA: DUF898 family protein [Citrobacter farmeri]|uniref:YjgN family protein n=1 Tax=Citrobacter farmeri TaxID=67824 RepID=UPI001E4B56C8|nr:DUF898 family protein [Citrobacter farmeri]GJL44280.1 membrane protein [Citrobacter farmeri]HEM7969535.1 DUF898 family protein [Citrobacter farmeri]HEM7984390.1 DUF898 family protein [Citrobacter farmeri]